MKVEKSYIICSAPRTGSNLLATALRKTMTAGQPYEYIDIYKQPRSAIRAGIPSGVQITNLADWFEYIMSTSAATNGVFGTTIHWWQLQQLLPALAARNITDSETADLSVRTLQSFFPNLKLIWLRRDNKVAQGISHYLAIQSGIWLLNANAPPESTRDSETPYNFNEIDRLVEDAAICEQGWRNFLQPVSDTTLELTYEELNSDLDGSVARVLQHLDLPPTPIGTVEIQKQASARSIKWERRYCREKEIRVKQETEQPMGETAHRRVCLVTTEFHGLFRNGGIGTANTSLALALAERGHHVTVAFASADENGPRLKDGNFADLQYHYAELGITLDFTPPDASAVRGFNDVRSASYSVYRYLQRHEFDIVFFNDCGGHGFYPLLAKHTGTFLNPPIMYVVAHGPLEWVHDLNAAAFFNRHSIVTAYIERRCIELADGAFSPSRYLIDWMVSHGWTVPAKTRVIQNIVRVAHPADSRSPQPSPNKVKELVFFGRLEVRKGLELFCDAIDLLEKSLDLSGVQITFMGKFDKVGGLHSGVYVLERSRRWKALTRLIVTYDQQEGLDYLGRDGVLAVIPSVAENSPCVVSECLQLGIPFIATGTGGTPELVAEADRDHCLSEPTPASLMAKLRDALQYGQRPANIAISQAQTTTAWLDLVEGRSKSDIGIDSTPTEASPTTTKSQPIVSVCLVMSEQSSATRACLDSVFRQDCGHVEILLIQNGDGNSGFDCVPEEINDRITCERIVNSEPVGSTAARNAAAARAKGEYLLFLDEQSVVLTPACIAALIAAADKTGADIVTGISMQFDGTGTPKMGQDEKLSYSPVGACLELGAFENCFGEGAILVRRQSFMRQKGFEPTGDRSFENWLFLANAAISGLHIEVVPQPLFWQRTQAIRELSWSDGVLQHRRILEAYGRRPLSDFHHISKLLLEVAQPNNLRLAKTVSMLGSKGTELATILSNQAYKLSDEDIRQKFFQYCLERKRTREALDFVLMNDPALLPDALNAAAADAKSAAAGIVQIHLPEFLHEIALTDVIKRKIKPVSSLTISDVEIIVDGIASHRLSPDIAILKAVGVCPPGIRTLDVEVNVESPRAVQLAAVVSPPLGRLVLDADGLIAGDENSWSGWVTAEGDGEVTKISTPISQRLEEPLDLFLLSRMVGDDAHPTGSVIWQNATASVSVSDAVTPSMIELESNAVPISESVRARGTVLTDLSNVTFTVFRPGERMLLHPIPGKTSLARFSNALPPGAKGVRCVFSIEDERAHDIEFGVWLNASSVPASNESDLAKTGIFSGWICVRDRLKRHQITIRSPHPIDEDYDLYLGTRVPDRQNAWHCRAIWHEIFSLE